MEEVAKLIDGIKSSVEALKETQSKFVGEHVEPLLKEREERIVDSITKNLEAVQKAQSEEKARMDAIEAAVNRAGFKGSEKEEGKQALDEFLRKGVSDGREAREVVVKTMRTDDDPAGGYITRPSFYGGIMERIFETSPMRDLATVETGTALAWEEDLDDDESAARWVGQGASGGLTDTPKLGRLKFDAHKIEAEPKATTEQLEDSEWDVETWLQGKSAKKFARSENSAFVTGGGVYCPRGILAYEEGGSSYERGKIETVLSGAAGLPTVEGLIDLQNALLEDFQSNATWLMHRTVFGRILKLKGTDKFHFLGLQPTDRGGFTMNILDRPVRMAGDMPVAATNSKSIAYGDFREGYLIYDRAGITILRDPYSSKGFVSFYMTKRVGGGVKNVQAIKIQKFATP